VIRSEGSRRARCSSGATGASVRSDIYALGLVLYEIYTGKRAFTATSLAKLRVSKEQELAAAPSELIKDMDPSVERVILRALARDPRARVGPVHLLSGHRQLQGVVRRGRCHGAPRPRRHRPFRLHDRARRTAGAGHGRPPRVTRRLGR